MKGILFIIETDNLNKDLKEIKEPEAIIYIVVDCFQIKKELAEAIHCSTRKRAMQEPSKAHRDL
jgi:hypothetical protein